MTDHSQSLGQAVTARSSAASPAVVLVRPQMGENIGMAARAMANFGLCELRLVAPRDGWPNQKAVDAAVGAASIVERARVFQSVREAIEDFHKVFVTTSRERGQAKPVLGADTLARETVERIANGQRIGILFGPERTGLENDDIALADAIVSFPVNPAHPSLNLAQAVSLVAYEWFKVSQGAAPPFNIGHETPPATRDVVLGFFAHLEAELDAANYFIPANKRPIMARNLFNIFHRAGLTHQDVQTLRGVVRALAHGRKSRARS
jgi:tRNA/rRNA methyltransferase